MYTCWHSCRLDMPQFFTLLSPLSWLFFSIPITLWQWRLMGEVSARAHYRPAILIQRAVPSHPIKTFHRHRSSSYRPSLRNQTKIVSRTAKIRTRPESIIWILAKRKLLRQPRTKRSRVPSKVQWSLVRSSSRVQRGSLVPFAKWMTKSQRLSEHQIAI